MIYDLLLNILLTIFIGMYFNKYANKFGLIDNPNSRSSHNTPTARGFGVVLFISIYITLFAFHYSLIIDNILLLVSIFIVMMIGLLDDAKGSSPIVKITSLFIAYIMLYLDGYVINNLGVFCIFLWELEGAA
jgi:UDP-N-acetylmuramyl pentapeptide phosphotransferase/UDP-N-acetylglucosamine-1-phosphate transferase